MHWQLVASYSTVNSTDFLTVHGPYEHLKNVIITISGSVQWEGSSIIARFGCLVHHESLEPESDAICTMGQPLDQFGMTLSVRQHSRLLLRRPDIRDLDL